MLGSSCRCLALVGLVACARAAPVAPAPAATSTFVVAYREPANVFEILDNVSAWFPGKCDAEYRTFWQERFGVSDEDDQAFVAYKAMRERHYAQSNGAADPATSANGLFGIDKPTDVVAHAFYEASSMPDAFARLAPILSGDELAMLRAFYARFEPRLATLLSESRAFAEYATTLERKLASTETEAFVRTVARAYEVPTPRRFVVLYVWWPPGDHSTANNRGEILLLKYNPKQDADAATGAVDVPIHELVHHVSGQQSEARKRALTKTFLAGCNVAGTIDPVRILEEPLAVTLQKLYLRRTDPERLDFTQPWYGHDPWVSTFAKLLYNPLAHELGAGRKIDETLMRRSARLCAQLVATGASLRPR